MTDSTDAGSATGTGDSLSSMLRIDLLGGFRIASGGVELPGDAWKLRNAARLIKRLALSAEHAMLREQLLDYLWPETDVAAASNSLRQTLHVARRQLRKLPLDPSLILRPLGDRVQLYPPDQTRTDVQAFEAAAQRARESDDPANYWSAIEQYTGPLLPDDPYEEWTTSYRDDLAAEYRGLLHRMALLYEERGERDQAIAALRRLIADEPAQEAAHVRLMRLYAASGRRAQAMRQFRTLTDALRETLDIEPEPETVALFQEIKEGRFRIPVVSTVAKASANGSASGKTNVPSSLTSFIGREREIATLVTLIQQNRLVTLAGTGGSGKTRLALEIARSLVSSFADGVWLVELAPLHNPDLIAGAIASTFRIREDADASFEDAIVDYLRDRSVLMVLDNCEHLLSGCAHIAHRLLNACPDLQLLVTGRSRLDTPGEVVWNVSPLPVPGVETRERIEQLEDVPSVRLFLERSRMSRPEFGLTAENVKDVATICRRVDGLPLAIELAASRTNVLTVREISERLSDSLSLLVGKHRYPERHRALRAALEWSERLLSPAEQVVFRRMAVFTSDCDFEAIEAVCAAEVGPAGVLDLLSALVDKSLVTADVNGSVGRYRMLEPVRQFALERLDASGETVLTRERHAAYFLALAESAEIHLTGPRQRAWFAKLESEDEHLRAALAWLAKTDDSSRSLRLAVALWRDWYQRGHGRHGMTTLVSLLERNPPVDRTIRANALLGAGAFLFRLGELSKARGYLEESLSSYRALGDPGGLGWATAFLGHVVGVQHEDDFALTCAKESLALFRQTHDLSGMARALNALGEVARAAGEDDEAASFYAEALEIDRAIGDLAGIALRLHNLGYVALHRGAFDRAVARFSECMEIHQDMGDLFLAAISAQGLAVTAAAAGRARAAALLFGAADGLRQLTGGIIDVAERADHERFTTRTKAVLGAVTFDALWRKGHLLSHEELLDWARDDLLNTDLEQMGFGGHGTRSTRRSVDLDHQIDITLNEMTRYPRSDGRY